MDKKLHIPVFLNLKTIESRTYRTPLTGPQKLPNGKFKTPQSVINYTNSFMGRLATLVKGAKASSKVEHRNLEFLITRDDLLAQWQKQEGICVYTGWNMSTMTKDIRLVSIERINGDQGYVKQNILLVCWCANRARNTMLRLDFIAMCHAIASHQKQQHNISLKS